MTKCVFDSESSAKKNQILCARMSIVDLVRLMRNFYVYFYIFFKENNCLVFKRLSQNKSLAVRSVTELKLRFYFCHAIIIVYI